MTRVTVVLASALLVLAGCTSHPERHSAKPAPTPSRSAVGVPSGQAGVPVPTSGFYWGGTNYGDRSAVPGCPVVTGNEAKQYAQLECKLGWAAGQLGLARPAAVTGSAVNTTMARAYLHNENGCRTDLHRLKPGGDVYQLAATPGRRVLMLSTKCGPWTDLASGGGNAAADQDVRRLVDAVVKLPVPVILIFHHEPENDACREGSASGTPDDYRRAFRQFAADVRAEEAKDRTARISLGWVLMGGTFDAATRGDHAVFTGCGSFRANGTATDNPLRNPDNWYAGDDVVDWIGADVYTHGTQTALSAAVHPFVSWATGSCPAQHPVRDWSCTPSRSHKPLALAEFGPGLGGPPSQQQKAAWLDQLRIDIVSGRTDLAKIKAFAYWSSGGQDVIDMPPDPAHPALLAYTRLSLLSQARAPSLATPGT